MDFFKKTMIVVLVAGSIAGFMSAIGYFSASLAYDAAIADVESGNSDAWKERCFESDRLEEARQRAMAKADAAKNLAGVEVTVTPEIRKVLDKCLEAGGTVDGVGGNGVVCMMPY